MRTRPIVKRADLVLMIAVPGASAACRGMLVTLASDARRAGVIFDLSNESVPIVHVCWFNQMSQKFTAEEFFIKCRLGASLA